MNREHPIPSTEVGAGGETLRDRLQNLRRKLPDESGITFVLLVVLICGAFATPNFLTLSNVNILLLNGAVVGFLCLGQTFVLLTGGIDLACGSITALTCVTSALLMSLGMDWQFAVLASLLIGIFAGATSGFLITATGVPPFIVTFAMMGVAGAIPQIITGAETIQVTQEGYKVIGQSYVFGVPFPVLALGLATVGAILFLKRSVLGTHIYAVGGNSEAARLAGVNVRKVTILVYSISGFCGAMGGLIYGSRLMNGYPTAGRGDELFFSIAGAVVGGVSLFGGKGSIAGAAIGATLVATISNLMNVLNVDSYWQPLVIGLIILAGVTFDTMRSRKH